jgi:tetratricopeptide (TPR) repeat protein
MRLTFGATVLLFAVSLFLLPVQAPAQDQAQVCPPDKELCAKMIRKGKEAYWRGKYQVAKAYFRRAIKADAASERAWQAYDLAVIHAMANKADRNLELITLEKSAKEEARGEEPAKAEKEEKEEKKEEGTGSGFTIIQDEGC